VCRSEQKLRDGDLGQVIQDRIGIPIRKNVAIDMDLDAALTSDLWAVLNIGFNLAIGTPPEIWGQAGQQRFK